MLQTKDANTLYFILDKPFIFLGSVQYGVELDAQKHLIKSVSFDSETYELILGIYGGSTERVPVNFKIASESKEGLMSPQHVADLEKVTTAVGDIDNIQNFVEQKVDEKIAVATIDPEWNEVQ